MNAATRSIRPWFVHPRMVPKWAGLLLTGTVAFLFLPERAWVFFLVGVALFFPSEYIVHRGVFHYFADKKAGKVLSKQHVKHHEAPDDLDYLFNDPRISVSVGVLYFIVYYAATRELGASAMLSFGNFAGLLYYEHVHFSAHRPGSRPWTPWGRLMKRIHLWHHYKHERHWYGVTSPVFDFLFGSWRDHKKVEASATVRTLVPTEEQLDWMKH